MQNMQDIIQNLQNTADILTKRCSRCKKEQVIEKFGFKKNEDPFKTCKRCRKQSINTNNNNPGSSNDHLNLNQVVENPIIEVIENPRVETVIENLVTDDPIFDTRTEEPNFDSDDINSEVGRQCAIEIESIFRDYGYTMRPFTIPMEECMFDFLYMRMQ